MSMSAAMAFPTTAEMTHVVRNTATDTSLFRGHIILPTVPVWSTEVMVDVIEEAGGLTAPRNLGTNPKVVTLSGQSVRKYATGYWSETYRLGEDELLNARMEGTLNQRAGRQRVTRRTVELNTRLVTRKEQLIWEALVTGKTTVDDNNVKYTVDHKIPNSKEYDLLTDPALEINEMITDLQKVYKGTGGKLDTIYFNTTFAEALVKNQNFRDLLKQSNYAALLSTSNVTTAMQLLFPSVKFELFEEGYSQRKKNGAKEFVPFIPEDGFVCVGRGHEAAADFASTLAIQNGGVDNPQPGKYSVVDDRSADAKNPYIDITVGENGLPRFHHPEWFIKGKIK